MIAFLLRSRWPALGFAIAASAALAVPAQATSFAVLLSGGSGDQARVRNPTYEAQQTGGESALYEPSAIIFSPPQLTSGEQVLLTVNFDDSITEDYPSVPAGGFVFEVLLEDASSGTPITLFGKPIEIGFDVPRLEDRGDLAGEGLAMSFYDPAADAWLVEDDSLMSCDHGGLCGKTTHFTVFAIGPAPVPEPNALLLASAVAALSLSRRRR